MSQESPPDFFATTSWTLVDEAMQGGGSLALEALFGTYWRPLYRYARRRGKSKEDAEDLVQGFLAHLTKSSGLQAADRSRGRLRTFLLASFNRWMINDWKHAMRKKRGGGVFPLSFDWENAENGLILELSDDNSPDRMFDREWAVALLGKVLEELKTVSFGEGHSTQFEALKNCLTADSARVSYAGLAAELSMSEGAIRVAVHRLRKRYRNLLMEEIIRTLPSPEAAEEEIRSLFAAFAR